jgi:membrane fusion protein, multidrug efflux system
MSRALCLMLCLAMPAAAEDAPPAEAAPRPVVSMIADLQDELSVSYVGTIAAKVEVALGFPMIGTIAERPVSQGDTVQEGEVLAQLDPEDLDSGVRAAEAGVSVAKAQANSARDTRDRAQVLASRGVGSQTRLDDAERALVAAEARLEQADAAMARARDLRALAILKAPWDGIVTQIYEDPGATLAAGQAVLQLSGTREREVVIDLNEAEAAALKPGTEFVARLVADTDVSARARLDRVDPVAEKSTRTRRAHLLLETPPEAFRLGALAHVARAAAAGAAIVLPVTAILDAQADPAVWVVDRSKDAVRRTPIQLGETLGGYTIVTSGLSAGDEIVTRGIHSLQDGQIVGPRVSR